MKRIVSFIFISVCFFIFPLEILAKEETNKQEVPFEIYSIHYDNENIIIDGWGMLTEQQHFNSTTSHSYTLELVSDKNHYLSFSSEPKKNDQTENMRVYGNPMCGLDALHQSSSVCNYTYSNVGFTFSIPLNELKKGHSYSATLAITAHHTKVTKRTPLFYPILSPVSKTIGTVQYKVGASLYDTSLKVAQDAVFELKEPQKGKYRAGNVYCAGHGYIRYYRQHSVYKNIYDRYFDGKTTFYKVKTNQFSQCVGVEI